MAARFAPAENTAFFEPYGWREAEYVDLFLEAHTLGREPMSGKVLRTVYPLMPRGVRKSLERALGIARFVRA